MTTGARSKRPAPTNSRNKQIIAYLSDRDPALGKVIERVGDYKLAVNPLQNSYEALAESIIYQQITGKAAASILKKVVDQVGDLTDEGIKIFPQANTLLKLEAEALRACGLSRSKQLALIDLANKMSAGDLPSKEEMLELDDQELIEKLITIRGIGTWTVQMLLIFNLGRPDVMPHTDYGIRKGFTLSFPRSGTRAKDGLATPASVLKRAEKWRPYRTCASWYLWRSLDVKG